MPKLWKSNHASWTEVLGGSMEAKCNECGRCCRTLAIQVPLSDTSWHNFYSARGLKTDEDYPEIVLIPSVCQYLTVENKCQIWDGRPEVCRGYPQIDYSYVPKGCVFRGDKPTS